MALAIGQPLQDVSETVLKGMNSKSYKSGIKKYNAEKSKGYNVVKPKNRTANATSPSRTAEELHDFGSLSKSVKNYLSELTTGASCKLSLLKMQVVKADENGSILGRLAHCLNTSEIQEA